MLHPEKFVRLGIDPPKGVFFAMVLLVLEKSLWLELWRIEPMLALSRLFAVSSFRSTSVKELG